MPKYRKLPVVIEAVQFHRFDMEGVYKPFPAWASHALHLIEGGAAAEVQTLEGNMRVSDGDYVICGVNGEVYPCKPDIFEKTYELVDD